MPTLLVILVVSILAFAMARCALPAIYREVQATLASVHVRLLAQET